MNWFLQARRVPILAAMAIILVLATCLMTPLVAPVPSLVASTARGIAVAMALPVVAALPIIGAFAGGHPERELAAVRNVPSAERALAASTVTVTVTLLAISALLLDAPLLLAGARNLAGTVGLGLLLRPWVPSAGTALAPAAFAAATFSLASRTEPPLWAWLLAPPDSPSAAAIAAGLLGLGMLLGVGRRGTLRQATPTDT